MLNKIGWGMAVLIAVTFGGVWFFQKYKIIPRLDAIPSSAITPAENSASTTNESATVLVQTPDSTEALIQFISSDFSEETPSSTIRAFYPQISNPATDGQTKFNVLVNALVEKFVAQFKHESLSAVSIPDAKNSFTWAYDLKYQDKNIISVLMSGEQYVSGSAHPSHPMAVVNFDLAEGKLLSLVDIFKTNTKYLDTLSNFSRQELEARNAKNKFTEEKDILAGTKPQDENFSMFNLSADGLVISFPEYQVAPYVAGTVVVTMPWSGLADMLSDQSPFKSFDTATSSSASNNQ